jgi:hypothetical protein
LSLTAREGSTPLPGISNETKMIIIKLTNGKEFCYSGDVLITFGEGLVIISDRKYHHRRLSHCHGYVYSDVVSISGKDDPNEFHSSDK